MNRARVLRMVVLMALGCGHGRADAKTVFLQGTTETTVTDLLRPWTQAEACACCVCWATALGTIFSYWDDNLLGGTGPWELLLKNGNGKDQPAFQVTTGELYKLSGVQCKGGFGVVGAWFNECKPTADLATSYTNGSLGYSFTYDQDSWIWFNTDIVGPVSLGHPLYYVYYPEGTGAHAVVIVGYDDVDQTLFIYKNWAPVVTHKGFDEATDHCAIEILPGGKAPPPSSWTCSASQYGASDGCHCGCGAFDPDCDAYWPTPLNCPPNYVCNSIGTCQSSCKDLCVAGATQCSDSAHLQRCADQNGDGCSEWSSPVSCPEGYCNAGECRGCKDQCFAGQRRCRDDVSFEECVLKSGCQDWSAASPCPSPTTCVNGECRATHCSSTPMCSTGQRRCSDQRSFQQCDAFTSDGCPAWGQVQACEAGTACVDSHCVPPSDDGERCGDGVDNDGDALVDCEDPDCSAECQGGCACAVPSSPGSFPGSLAALLLGLMGAWVSSCSRRAGHGVVAPARGRPARTGVTGSPGPRCSPRPRRGRRSSRCSGRRTAR